MEEMSEIKLTNIPSMNVGQIVEDLSDVYCTVINQRLPLNTVPPVMLWGAPGVGKSQAIRQLAKTIEQNTNKKVSVTDVRLLLFNPIDLRGIPTSNADKTLAVWLKPQIFQMDGSNEVINILFLDEISAAPQSVQAAAYQITLDRVIGEDKSVAFKMPKALANRVLHIEVEGNFNSWKEWAIRSGINEKVIGFLSFRRNYLMGFDSSSDDLAFATPRSWEMVSKLLNHVNEDIDKMYSLVAGLVGCGVAVEFRTWAQVYHQLPDTKDIFDGKMPPLPSNTDAMYALTSSMVAYAREHKNEMHRIANSISYANKMPPDFSAILLKDYMYIEKNYKEQLMSIPEFAIWLRSKGRLINGSV